MTSHIPSSPFQHTTSCKESLMDSSSASVNQLRCFSGNEGGFSESRLNKSMNPKESEEVEASTDTQSVSERFTDDNAATNSTHSSTNVNLSASPDSGIIDDCLKQTQSESSSEGFFITRSTSESNGVNEFVASPPFQIPIEDVLEVDNEVRITAIQHSLGVDSEKAANQFSASDKNLPDLDLRSVEKDDSGKSFDSKTDLTLANQSLNSAFSSEFVGDSISSSLKAKKASETVLPESYSDTKITKEAEPNLREIIRDIVQDQIRFMLPAPDIDELPTNVSPEFPAFAVTKVQNSERFDLRNYPENKSDIYPKDNTLISTTLAKNNALKNFENEMIENCGNSSNFYSPNQQILDLETESSENYKTCDSEISKSHGPSPIKSKPQKVENIKYDSSFKKNMVANFQQHFHPHFDEPDSKNRVHVMGNTFSETPHENYISFSSSTVQPCTSSPFTSFSSPSISDLRDDESSTANPALKSEINEKDFLSREDRWRELATATPKLGEDPKVIDLQRCLSDAIRHIDRYQSETSRREIRLTDELQHRSDETRDLQSRLNDEQIRRSKAEDELEVIVSENRNIRTRLTSAEFDLKKASDTVNQLREENHTLNQRLNDALRNGVLIDSCPSAIYNKNAECWEDQSSSITNQDGKFITERQLKASSCDESLAASDLTDRVNSLLLRDQIHEEEQGNKRTSNLHEFYHNQVDGHLYNHRYRVQNFEGKKQPHPITWNEIKRTISNEVRKNIEQQAKLTVSNSNIEKLYERPTPREMTYMEKFELISNSEKSYNEKSISSTNTNVALVNLTNRISKELDVYEKESKGGKIKELSGENEDAQDILRAKRTALLIEAFTGAIDRDEHAHGILSRNSYLKRNKTFTFNTRRTFPEESSDLSSTTVNLPYRHPLTRCKTFNTSNPKLNISGDHYYEKKHNKDQIELQKNLAIAKSQIASKFHSNRSNHERDSISRKSQESKNYNQLLSKKLSLKGMSNTRKNPEVLYEEGISLGENLSEISTLDNGFYGLNSANDNIYKQNYHCNSEIQDSPDIDCAMNFPSTDEVFSRETPTFLHYPYANVNNTLNSNTKNLSLLSKQPIVDTNQTESKRNLNTFKKESSLEQTNFSHKDKVNMLKSANLHEDSKGKTLTDPSQDLFHRRRKYRKQQTFRPINLTRTPTEKEHFKNCSHLNSQTRVIKHEKYCSNSPENLLEYGKHRKEFSNCEKETPHSTRFNNEETTTNMNESQTLSPIFRLESTDEEVSSITGLSEQRTRYEHQDQPIPSQESSIDPLFNTEAKPDQRQVDSIINKYLHLAHKECD